MDLPDESCFSTLLLNLFDAGWFLLAWLVFLFCFCFCVFSFVFHSAMVLRFFMYILPTQLMCADFCTLFTKTKRSATLSGHGKAERISVGRDDAKMSLKKLSPICTLTLRRRSE